MLTSRRPTIVQAWWLAALLLLAQGLGLSHRIAHAPSHGPAQVHASAWGHDHEAGSADCRLVDQLAHADALCAPPTAALPLVATAQTAVAPLPSSRPADTAAAYLARAPPRG